MAAFLYYTGSIAIFLWGIGHLMPTRGIVRAFGPLTGDNRRIITMEWIAEGMTLCFIGVLVFIPAVMFGPESPTTVFAGRAGAGMLLAMAVLSAFTGARTSVLPMRLCPIVKTAVALLFLWAAS